MCHGIKDFNVHPHFFSVLDVSNVSYAYNYTDQIYSLINAWPWLHMIKLVDRHIHALLFSCLRINLHIYIFNFLAILSFKLLLQLRFKITQGNSVVGYTLDLSLANSLR